MAETDCCPCGCGRGYEVVGKTKEGKSLLDMTEWKKGHNVDPALYWPGLSEVETRHVVVSTPQGAFEVDVPGQLAEALDLPDAPPEEPPEHRTHHHRKPGKKR